jgi:uncharacterized protein (DUF1499 family)
MLLKTLLLLLLLLPVLLLVAGQAGLLTGKAPSDLGVREGRLKPPSRTENSVSSQAGLYPEHPMRAYAEVQPLPLRGDAAATLAQLQAVVSAMPGATVVQSGPDYLYARFTTRWLKFVDDVEFWADPAAGVVQVRSASRLGRKDFGVNRARVEAIRAAVKGG